MRKYSLAKVLMLGIVALAAEMTFLSSYTMFGARLELLLLLACFSALYLRTSKDAAIACWTLGLLKDIGGAGPMGVHCLLFLITGLIIVRIRQVLFGEHPGTQACVAFLGAAGVVLAEAMVTSMFAGSVPWGIVLGRTLGAAVFTALAAPVVIFTITTPRWLLARNR